MNVTQRCTGCGNQFPVEELTVVLIDGDVREELDAEIVKVCKLCQEKYRDEIGANAPHSEFFLDMMSRPLKPTQPEEQKKDY